MKINFDQVLNDLDGEPIVADGKPLTLCRVARNALLARFQDESPSGEESYHRHELARGAKGESDWTPEDVVLLKKLIAKAYTPLVIGPAFDAIEPKEGKPG